MTVSDPRLNKPWTKQTFVNLVCSVIGIGAGVYAGGNLLIPAATGGIAFWILRKTAWIKDRVLLTAASIQAGHAVWMLISLFLVSLGLLGSAEIIGYCLAVGLLVWRQEKWLVVALIAYQAICIVINTFNLLYQPAASVASHALVAHLLLRGGAIFYMLIFMLQKPKQENPVEVF